MNASEFHERLDRIDLDLQLIKVELDDKGPRLMPCRCADCERLTRANICLVCANAGKIELQENAKR